MERLLRSIKRAPEGVNVEDLIRNTKDGETVVLMFRGANKDKFTSEVRKPQHISGESVRSGREYIIKVKAWMTKPTLPGSSFDFMARWNNNVPMPFRVMRGRVLKETRGMVYMSLKAVPLRTNYCIRCGKPLTHPVSLLYGLGPECGQHAYINPFETEEELREHHQELVEKLSKITWTGWIVKSGIEYATEVK